MITQKQLNILLLLYIVLFTLTTLSATYYDPYYSPFLTDARSVQATFLVANTLATISIVLLELCTGIYAFLALWFGDIKNGKWVFLVYALLRCLDYYPAGLVVTTWLTMGLSMLMTILSGVILLAVFK